MTLHMKSSKNHHIHPQLNLRKAHPNILGMDSRLEDGLHGSDDGEPLQEPSDGALQLHRSDDVRSQGAQSLADRAPILVERHGGGARLRDVEGECTRHCEARWWCDRTVAMLVALRITSAISRSGEQVSE